MKKDYSEDSNLINRLNFLLNKVELAENEKQWLLVYLIQSKGEELRSIMYKLFEDTSADSNEIDKDTLERIRLGVHNSLFE